VTDTDDLLRHLAEEEKILVARYERLRRQAQQMYTRRQGVREAAGSVFANCPSSERLPLWTRNSLSATEARAEREYQEAMEAETAALADLSRFVDKKTAMLSDADADRAAGTVTE